MSLFGLLLIAGGIGFLCWLLFALAIYALPVFAGLSIAVAAFHTGAGYVGASILALAGGMVTFATGKFAFARGRSPIIRSLIGLLYTVPAAVAGFEATLGLARIGTPSEAWCTACAVVGAGAVGVTAWRRLMGDAIVTPPIGAALNPIRFQTESATRLG